MESSAFLRDLVILFGIAALISFLFRILRLSSIAGFLVAGAIIGPYGLRLISSVQDVEQMSEIGVMLLLFSIGVEFSAEKLMRMRWLALGGGPMQLLLTIGVTAIALKPVLGSTRLAIFAGILTALSSTVIAMRLLHERGQTFAPQGSAALALLIFQDLAVVPFMLFLPVLSGKQQFDIGSFVQTLLLSIVAVAAILAAAYIGVPRIIRATIASRSRDVFILSVIAIVLGTSWLTARAGLSNALGAFIAGIVLSESEYSHQVLADVLPFRETFNSLFFVSIGMLLNPAYLIHHAGWILLITAAILVMKTILTAGVIALLQMPRRIAWIVGVYLAQIGEFSLVLLTTARRAGSFDDSFSQPALSVILVSMMVAPFFALIADRLNRAAGLVKALPPEETPDLTDHTVVIGYGLNGQNVAASLRSKGMRYAILEMNPKTVRTARNAGEPIFFGDAISEVVLTQVGIQNARCAVFAISDPVATRQAVAAARRLNAEIYIIARTRYVAEIEELYAAGADTVITEEFETSLEIIRRILGRFGYRPNTIDREVLLLRQGRYEMFRGGPIEQVPIQTSADFQPFEVEVRARSEGKTLEDLQVRTQTGATVVAVRRDSRITVNPSGEYALHEGEHVYLIGNEDEIRRAMRLL